MISFTLPNRNGHHSDYLEFLVQEWRLSDYGVLRSFQEKMEAYRRGDTIVLLDIDLSDLLFVAITFLGRQLGISSKTKLIGISVRATEFLQERRTIFELLMRRGRLVYTKRVVKRTLFKALLRRNHLEIVGIFADYQERDKLAPYCTSQVHDFQYYDLDVLRREPKRPKELEGTSIAEALVVFVGSDQRRRNIQELREFLSVEKARGMKVLMVGGIDLSDSGCVADVTQIPRRLSDGELLWCLKNGGCVYCYYSNNAPSGFFGRSAQFGTTVLVKKDSYLDRSFYRNKITVRELKDFDPKSLLVRKKIEREDSSSFIKMPKPGHV